MMKDRDQKQMALRLSVANRWFPQPEVDVDPGHAVSEKILLVTDLDVLASIPDQFAGFRSVVFDCKTGAKQSAANRSLWLAGVLQRMRASQGFCILRKEAIALDHRLMANRLNIIILGEKEFDEYAKATAPDYATITSNVGDIDAWDSFFAIATQYPKLDSAMRFARAGFWMADDSAEACRRTLATLRQLQPELDPAKSEHFTVFLDLCALFARSLAVVICQIFKSYLQPASQGDLADALLVLLYGGREAYQHRNDLYKRLVAKDKEAANQSELALPEWDRFLQLVRQALDAPLEFQRTPLILREAAFSVLRKDPGRSFAKRLCSESPQGARFAVFVPNYLVKAARLPPEFSKISDDILLPLIPVK